MKTVRKFLAIIISVIMTLLSFSVLASGAQTVSYSANDVAGKKGETVTVTVKISSTAKIWGSNVSLSYNSSELQFVSCSKIIGIGVFTVFLNRIRHPYRTVRSSLGSTYSIFLRSLFTEMPLFVYRQFIMKAFSSKKGLLRKTLHLVACIHRNALFRGQIEVVSCI